MITAANAVAVGGMTTETSTSTCYNGIMDIFDNDSDVCADAAAVEGGKPLPVGMGGVVVEDGDGHGADVDGRELVVWNYGDGD